MQNPYEPPVIANISAQQPYHREINTVISGQKMLIYSILGYFAAVPFIIGANVFLEGHAEAPMVTPLFFVVLATGLLIGFGSAIFAATGILKMGEILFPGSTRVIYAIGVLIPIPLLGLIVMLVSNSKATSYLYHNGIRVGFLDTKKYKRIGFSLVV